MTAIKERIIGAVSLMSDKEAEVFWNLIQNRYIILPKSWDDIEEVEPDEIVVTLARQPKDQLKEVQAQVYLGVQKLFVRGTKLRMVVSSNGLTLKFTVTNYTQGKQFTSQDIEYFKSWGLTERQIKKIEVILG